MQNEVQARLPVMNTCSGLCELNNIRIVEWQIQIQNNIK